MPLPINLDDLLGARTVESDRIEFKEGWNPDAIYRTICAFANDFDNGGGGYVVVGVVEEEGRAKRPVKGLSTETLARIQREMIGFNNLIRPVYHPDLYIEDVDNQTIIVIRVLGSASRPHEVPEQITAKQKSYHYYIRQYANSIKVDRGELKQELLTLTNQVPFDDRPNQRATTADISLLWIREYLRVSGSRLIVQSSTADAADLLHQLALLAGPPEHQFPRNVALMLFCEYPENFFPYTYIELVHFRHTPGDRQFNEAQFKGPVQYQIRQFLDYIKGNILTEKVIKLADRAEAQRQFNYPLLALEEAIANCIFHRDYTVREPVKVFIEHNHIRLQNSGGPDRSIRLDDFHTGHVRPKRYRNRRLGDFLKDLDLTEGHATGIKLILDTMKANGSPAPRFDMDADHSFFEIELPIHEAFLINEEQEPTVLIIPTPPYNSMDYSSLQSLLNLFLVSENLTEKEREKYSALINKLDVTSTRILLAMDIYNGQNGQRTMKRKDIFASINLTNHTKNAERHLEPLIQLQAISPTIKDRPKSPLQAYFLTERGRKLVQLIREQQSSD